MVSRKQARQMALAYVPRPQFVDLHLREHRWAVAVAHRRAGKTVACVNDVEGLRAFVQEARLPAAALGRIRAGRVLQAERLVVLLETSGDGHRCLRYGCLLPGRLPRR